MWEYKITVVPLIGFMETGIGIVEHVEPPSEKERISREFREQNFRQVEQFLDELGAQGWEMISISPKGLATFKRPATKPGS